MSSKRKIDSARANGKKSHGPITGQGLKTSSMNALSMDSPPAPSSLPTKIRTSMTPCSFPTFTTSTPPIPSKWTT
jgi:hypothetical protein